MKSNQKEQTRMVTYVGAYKDALPEQPPAPPPPNNAARAGAGVKTKTQRYGATKLSPSGQASLSQKK